MFGVQLKHAHEYKRLLLNALRIIHDYFSIETTTIRQYVLVASARR